uniref:RING-type domain-containing protein n=1 Tax=Alexandrium andersonii TaxID=327968 RepID=A0A7S2DD23_9DINO
MLSKNVSVTVRRTPPQNSKKPSVLHLESTDVWSSMPAPVETKKEETPAPARRRSLCPPEYLCPLCADIFDDPEIARCCGRSACRRCFKQRQGDACPLCTRPWAEETTPIRNPRLADSVASLDLEYFILPSELRGRSPSPGDVKKEESTEGLGEEGAAAPITAQPASVVATGLPAAAVNSPPGAFGPPAPGPSAPTFLGPPPALPPGVTVRPCMLTPEQFHAWQQSIRRDADSESSCSPRSLKLSRRKSKDSGKAHKRRKSSANLCSDGSPERKQKKSHKKRRR